MSDESCDSKTHFFNILVSDVFFLFSLIFSNPLYLSYCIFFSPYLLKLISFLPPLFITTFIIFIAFLTGNAHENLSTDLARASSKDYYYHDEGFQGLDDLGMFEILFGKCLMNCGNKIPPEISGEKSVVNLESGSGKEKDSSFGKLMEVFETKQLEEKIKNPGPISVFKSPFPGIEEKRLNNFLKILDQFERMSTANVEEKKKISTKTDKSLIEGVRNTSATKVSVNGGKEHITRIVKAHSGRIRSDVGYSDDDGVGKEHKKVESFRTWDDINNNSSGSLGSMREGKEWKRTLACKLFEERHNVDGGEGMDSLWEAYEMKLDKSVENMSEQKQRNKKASEIEFNEESYGNEEDEEEDEVVDGHLCCLHAIKFSTGKMNLGIGRRDLVKISKAIKGFGWLHHVSKHSKKVHNNGER